MSTQFDPALLERFECDSCLIIKNYKKFIYHIGRALGHYVDRLYAVRDVDYDNRVIRGRYRDGKNNWENNRHPAFIKPPEYSIEREVRAVWIPKSAVIEPVIVTSIDAAAQCELYFPSRTGSKLAIEL